MTPLELSEIRRQLASLVAFGLVAEVEGGKAKVRIEGGLVTPLLPTLRRRAKGDTESWPLEVGEQVLCLFPSGSTEQGVILGSLMTRDGAPTDGGHQVSYSDGTSMSYDKSKKKLLVKLPPGGSIAIEAADATVNVTAKKVVVEAESVALGGPDAEGQIVTTQAICAFTGSPHPQGSTRCKAKHA